MHLTHCLFRVAALAAVFLTSFGPAAAQESEDKSPTVEFRVTRFDPGDGPPPEFRVGSEGNSVEFEVPLTHIAGPFEAPLRDERALDFWGEDSEKPELSVEITAAEREHLLLVFFPRDDGFSVLKVQTPPTRLKGGDRLIINTTSNELAIKLDDDEPLVIAPKTSGILSGPPGTEIVSLPVLISLKKEDGWELASTENWPCDPRFRKYLFAYISPRSRHLTFHGVSERL